MGSISDQALASGCAVAVETIHGETVKVLSGTDAGKTFIAVREVEADMALDGLLGADPRAKRVLRFRMPNVPALESQDRLQTDDGKIWRAVRRPDSAYLTMDFELTEVIDKDS